MNTDFSRKVYKVVSKIPRGRVLTYKQVAEKAGSPGAFRAVGNILNKNRDPKVYCHRVIKSDGTYGGYFGGTDAKILKLKKEGFVLK
jgi:methylated-DNA-[protein]-cysteine S-methyltransferase